jgi:hypothetical protein
LVRGINRLRSLLGSIFPALEAAFDYSARTPLIWSADMASRRINDAYQHLTRELPVRIRRHLRRQLSRRRDHRAGHLAETVQEMVAWGGDENAFGQRAIQGLAQRIVDEEHAIEGVCA